MKLISYHVKGTVTFNGRAEINTVIKAYDKEDACIMAATRALDNVEFDTNTLEASEASQEQIMMARGEKQLWPKAILRQLNNQRVDHTLQRK